MPRIAVALTFHGGVRQQIFRNVRVSGSWDANGMFSDQWTQTPMAAFEDETGCDAFSVTISLDESQVGTAFQWGVIADLAQAQDAWAVVTEISDPNSVQQTRSFVLTATGGREDYWFSTGRRFGAQKWTLPEEVQAGLQFSVWAPYARSVDVVFAPLAAAPATPRLYSGRRYRCRSHGSGGASLSEWNNGYLAEQHDRDTGALGLQFLHESVVHVPDRE